MTNDTQPKQPHPAVRERLESGRPSQRHARTPRWVVCLAFAAASALAAEPTDVTATTDLIVHAHGMKHDRGHLITKLYRQGQDVLGPPFVLLKTPIRQGASEVTFSALPAGWYAVMVFHDEDDDGKLRHNFLKIASEPMGFSNQFRPGLFTGMPSFEKLKFEVSATQPSINITVR